jgi:hypothetical protein
MGELLAAGLDPNLSSFLCCACNRSSSLALGGSFLSNSISSSFVIDLLCGGDFSFGFFGELIAQVLPFIDFCFDAIALLFTDFHLCTLIEILPNLKHWNFEIANLHTSHVKYHSPIPNFPVLAGKLHNVTFGVITRNYRDIPPCQAFFLLA